MTQETEITQKQRTLDMQMSNSKIDMFEQCPRKFYYRYIMALPQKQKSYFLLGTFVHRVLEIFYQVWMKNNAWGERLRSLMGKAFEKTREEQPEVYSSILLEAKGILMAYLDGIIAKMALPQRMDRERKFVIEVDGVEVIGFIDRVDYEDGGQIKIIDYKTGKRAKSEKDFAKDLQLPIYALAMHQELDIHPDDMVLKLDHVRLGTEQVLKPSMETVERAKKKIVLTYEAIEATRDTMDQEGWSSIGPDHVANIRKNHREWSNELEREHLLVISKFSRYWHPNEGWYCRFCDFAKVCNSTLW